YLGDREQKAFRASVRELFQRVLERSLCTAPFIGTIQRICFEEPELLRSSSLIGTTSYKSLNFHTGIMLLEKQILHSKGAAGDQAALKKKKLGTQPASLGHGDDAWVHLAKLYEALGEEDILLGVYEKHIARTELTKRALEAQLRNDYASAMKL